MPMTMQDRLVRDGYARPVYLSLTSRAWISPHTGTPILEAFNEVYGYWATERDLTAAEVVEYLGETYLGNMNLTTTQLWAVRRSVNKSHERNLTEKREAIKCRLTSELQSSVGQFRFTTYGALALGVSSKIERTAPDTFCITDKDGDKFVVMVRFENR